MNSSLQISLYGFQKEAVDKLTKPGITSRLIGDDMGLGKTLEALAIDKEDRKNWRAKNGDNLRLRTLIVAPLPVLEDAWLNHIKSFDPQARVVLCDPKDRPSFVKALKIGGYDYYVIHYEGSRLIAAELQKITWFHIILDEVQRIKNKDAKVTKAIKGIRAKRKTALSGTPADDKPYDLWSIINFLWPSYYRSYWKFRGHYCLFTSEVNYQTGQTYQKFAGVQNGKALQREMSPWFVRRLKEDVLEDLPDKYYTPIRVELHPKQRKAYEEMKRDMLTWVGENENTALVASVAVAKLIRLQQFALGYMEAYEVEVRKRNLKNTDWIRNKDGNVRLFKETRWRISEPSSKLDALMEVIDETDRQIVVFSQFKSVLTLLSRRLEKVNISHGLYTGDVNPADRNRLVKNFQAGNTRVFAGTIAAGGTGLTLTAASTVAFLDRSWKPTQNFQAEDRLHRIGQPNAVQIIDFIAKNTVDMGRLQTISWKWSMLKEILGDNNR
jgi:SNF2 family DNA or RNA helicase